MSVKGCRFIFRLMACFALSLSLASVALAQNAHLTLYVFKKGLPVAGIETFADSKLLDSTNEQGVVKFDIAPGPHRLELRDQDTVVLDQPILAHEDEIAQWIVNITRGLSALTDVESSSLQSDIPAQIPLAGQPTDSTPGTLMGKLISAEDKRPVEGARIFISGQARDFRSGEDGVFKAELPAGSYSVTVLHSGFNSITRDSIEVTPRERTEFDLVLTPAGTELPEFLVIEPYIAGSLASVLEERRTDAAVSNILGSEQISKAGDSDAAGALSRVTGLTLVDGKFIYIRGLGERYSSTLLNGANVPSPDPTRRVVPLNLFPAEIIDSIAVRKGYTSNLPGEFGGGTVEIRTRSVPENPFFSIEASLGYREGTTSASGLSYAGGSSDWTGYDDGTRNQPSALAQAIADGTELKPYNRFTGVGFQPEELETIGESLASNYDVKPKSPGPDTGLKASGGYLWKFGNDIRLGFLAATEHSDKWRTYNERQTDYTNSGDGTLQSENDYIYNTTKREIGLSGYFTVGLQVGENNTLTYDWMLLRDTSDKAQIQQGFNKDTDGGDVKFTELEWIERQMQANQLLGEHTLPLLGNLKFDWQLTQAKAKSDAPDTRRYRYDPDTLTPQQDDFIFSLRNDSNQRRWSKLGDHSDSYDVNAIFPVKLWKRVTVDVSAGFSHVKKSRDSAVRRFSFKSSGSISGNIELRRHQSLEDVITADTVDPQGWQLVEVTIPTDAYTAKQVIDAWHTGLDFHFGDVFRLSTGFDNEKSDQSVSTFNLFDPERNPVNSSLNTKDSFPFVSASLILGSHQIRAGYAETTNRPDFKELAESFFKDPVLDRLVQGNPDLVPAKISHYDLRWDYYFNPSEFISLGAFYKEFRHPIESVILASPEAKLSSFDNAEVAKNFGAEFELYETLGFLNDWWGWGSLLENFHINTNFAWIKSDITLSKDNAAVQTSLSRPLQGQSPYVWNFQIGYDDEARGINSALLFRVSGKRITDVGINGSPDIYEQPRPSLDFIYSQTFRCLKLKLKAENLLDPKYELTQGPETTRVSKAGRVYRAALEYTFD